MVEWFEGLQMDDEGGETILSGTLPDQSALYGLLGKLRDLGISVITVRRLSLDESVERPS